MIPTNATPEKKTAIGLIAWLMSDHRANSSSSRRSSRRTGTRMHRTTMRSPTVIASLMGKAA